MIYDLEQFLAKLSYQLFDKSIEIKVGDVLKMKDGTIYLVGHVNDLLGLCDDCTITRANVVEISNIEKYL